MGRAARQSDYVSIVERCYDSHESDAAWLTELFATAAPLLDVGGGLGLSLVREGPNGRTIELSEGTGPVHAMVRASWPILRQVDQATYRKFYYPAQPVLLASSLVAGFARPLQLLFRSVLGSAGASDLLGMLGYPAPGWAFAMFVAVGERPIHNQLRDTMRRLRIHVEASLRLRMFASSESVAVIRPDGQLEWLADDSLVSARNQLTTQAAAIERVRTARGRADPHRALEVWHALVDGRFSLVERVDRDGKRHYHAFENAPHVREHRALTETEALVVELALRGLTGKEIAYGTGLSQSRISTALALAAERLGFGSREQLLRVGARILAEEYDDEQPRPELTQAEQEVLGLVRRGLSNRAIAEARGTSVNTVANQLASLLRKTGAGSRRALIVRQPPVGLTRGGEHAEPRHAGTEEHTLGRRSGDGIA